MKGRLAVLTPVRNGEDDLTGYLASVGRFADVVIALDDGSTDATREILDAAAEVDRVLVNPPRPSYVGWHDADNRQRLLEELDDFGDVDWVMFLDVDEQLDAADSAALRRFVDVEALRGFAYGFEIFRMVEDGRQYDAESGMWVYRLFPYQPGLQMPRTRLHFVPIPESIPRRRWIRTTIRIQHFGSATPERRAQRFDKYGEADPEAEYQETYAHLLNIPEVVATWKPRPVNTPPVVSEQTKYSQVLADLDGGAGRPSISAVVISRDDADTIADSVRALVDQHVEGGHEVIMVTSGTDGTAELVASSFPEVRVIQLPQPALPGEARNAGLWLAHGYYVTFPGSHVVVSPGSLQARLDAHEAGWDLVTGTTLNGNDTRAGWASYFLDHSSVLPGRPSGEIGAAPSHCSYARRDLDEGGGFPEDMRSGEDTVVNNELFRRGRTAYREQAATIVHAARATTASVMAQHHFGRGRAWGRILLPQFPSRRRLLRTRVKQLLGSPSARLRMVRTNVRQWGDSLADEYRRARWHLVLGAVASGLGTLYQVMRGSPREHGASSTVDSGSLIVAHAGSPVADELGLGGRGSARQVAARVDRHARRQTPMAVPAVCMTTVVATVVPSEKATYTETVSEEYLAAYLRAVREVGGMLILGIQPGRASFADAIAVAKPLIGEPDVGLALLPRWSEATSWPAADLDATLALIDGATQSPTAVLIHSDERLSWPTGWTADEGRHLDVIAIADVTGDLEVKSQAVRMLSTRAPSVGVKFRYRRDPIAPEPTDLLEHFGELRIVIYE